MATLTAGANASLVGWAYWQWKQYNDPYGGTDQGIVEPDGHLDPRKVGALAQTYAQAVAGIPTAMSFDPSTGAFSLSYQVDPAVRAPTVIFVPVTVHYPRGYCAAVTGGRITSGPDAAHLTVANSARAKSVRVTVRPGRC